MKTLFVVNGIDDETLITARCKKEKIAERLGKTIDTCVYAYVEVLSNLSLKLLGGRIYTLGINACISEEVSRSICELIKAHNYDSVIISDCSHSDDLVICIADMLGMKCTNHVTDIHYDQNVVLCDRMIYNNSINALIRFSEGFVISEKLILRETATSLNEPLEIIPMPECISPDFLLDDIVVECRQKQTSSPILIAAGMGIKNKDDLIYVRNFAKKHGFSFGVSRPVAMRGWAKIDEIIGVSGNIFSPKVTIAIGISGAPAFIAGIEQSKYILSINSDPDAHIAELSDAIIVDEYQKALPLVFEYLENWIWKKNLLSKELN